MLILTEIAKRFVEEHRSQEFNLDERCISVVSLRQLQIVTALFHLSYESRCSFQEVRFRVSFFTPLPGETIYEFLTRRVFRSANASYVPNLCTDESHEPDGLVLTPDGSLTVYRDRDEQQIVYSGIEKVIERDSMLHAKKYEFVGTIIFSPNVSLAQVSSALNDFILYEAASDHENNFFLSKDSICLLQWWHRFYTPSFMVTEKDCTMRIFAASPEAFEKVFRLFKADTIQAAVPELPSRC